MFGSELENVYDKKISNNMNRINDKYINNIAEFNLLHNVIDYYKCTKNINTHYSFTIHGCMDTRMGEEKHKKLYILLDIGCSYTIVMRILPIKHRTKMFYSAMEHASG